MTREEWYKSPKFKHHRLLNNYCSDIGHKAQELRDLFDILTEQDPELCFGDRFSVVERQLRVLELESKNLWTAMRRYLDQIEPKIDDC